MLKKIDAVRTLVEKNIGQAVAFCFGSDLAPEVYVAFPTEVQGKYLTKMTLNSDRHAIVSLDGSVSYIEGGMVVEEQALHTFHPSGLVFGEDRVRELLRVYNVSSDTVLTKLQS